MSGPAMEGEKGYVAYGNVVLASATEICEVDSHSDTVSRDKIDAGNRCDPEASLAGKLNVEVTGTMVLNKSAAGGSVYDSLMALMLDVSDPAKITHVWSVDKYNDGIYFAEGRLTNLSKSQPLNDKVTADFSIVPTTQVYRVVGGVITSSP